MHTPSRAAVLSHLDAETAVGDVLDSGSLSRACEGVDTVVHLVAAIRESGRLTFQRVNFEGTRNLLQAASEARVKRVIYSSTIGASSDPAIPYMNSRWMAEQETVNSDILYTIIRFSVSFGEGDEFFNVLAAQVKLFPLVPVVGSGKTRFQPIAADDVARCIVDACEKEDTVGRTFEVGGPTYITYDGMLDLVAETLGARIAKVHVPLPLVRPVVAIMQALVPRPPVNNRATQDAPSGHRRGLGFDGKELRLPPAADAGEPGLPEDGRPGRRDQNEPRVHARPHTRPLGYG